MVNFEAARRQALGTHFTEAENESELVSRLKKRRLYMAPHKAWTLPEAPTWRENPFDDNNWEFQYHMLRWLDPLRRAGAAGDLDAASLWEKYARSWIEANPPGSAPYKWSWVDMSDGIRAMELCHGLTVVGEQPWLIDSLRDHVNWLLEPSHLKRGNHGFHQHVGLFVLGVVLEDQEVTDVAVKRLTDQLDAAYDEQGANEEGSISYHLQNYVWWNDALTRLDREGIPRPEQAHRLELAPTLMAHATAPSGRFARIGDTDGGNARKLNHPHTKFTVTEGKKGRKPDATTAIYDAGYAFMRSGWGEVRPYKDETFVTATWGRQDKVHGHRDGGSVTYASDGIHWIDDTGKYYYGKSAMRSYVTGRAGHNSIRIPDRTYRKDTDVELIGREETSQFVDLTFRDPGYEGITISRRVIYLRGRDLLLVLDQIAGDDEITAVQQWHCGRSITSRALGTGFRLEAESGARLVIALHGSPELSVTRGQEQPMAGWTSTGWRKKGPVDLLTFQQTERGPRFATLVGTWDPQVIRHLEATLPKDGAWEIPVSHLFSEELLEARAPKADDASGTAAAAAAVTPTSAQPVEQDTAVASPLGSDEVVESDPEDILPLRTQEVPSSVNLQDSDAVAVMAEHGRVPGENVAKTVVIETVFCDGETKLMTQMLYFRRFERTLLSMSRVRVPQDVRAIHIIYISSDKKQWLPRLRSAVKHFAHTSGMETRIVVYAHPSHGYPALTAGHPDVLKGPNKQAPLRNRLFLAAQLDIAPDHTLVRMTIDDDDLWLPWQLDEMIAAIDQAYAHTEYPTFGIGLRRNFLAHVDETGVRIEDVSMSRMLTGNKAFVFPPQQREKALLYAPWNVPETMTENYREQYRAQGIDLLVFEGNRPGFVYMRRGNNLSNQQKTGFITATHEVSAVAAENALLDHLSDPTRTSPPSEGSFTIDPPVYRITVKRSGEDLSYHSNVKSAVGDDVRLAFHLLRGTVVVAKTGYGRVASGVFRNAPPGCRVKMYVQKADHSRESKVSNVV